MNWKDYEDEIHAQLLQLYPDAIIRKDVKIMGRYSNTLRQIDILIEDEIAGFVEKIAVDAKFYTKKIDVKCVECYLSMMDDVGVSNGLLVTRKGYSNAALNRAHSDPRNLELDILNFDPLHFFQSFCALPYSGEDCVFISAPFGFVIELDESRIGLAFFVPRGKNLKQAMAENEWMDLNIFYKQDHIDTIRDLLQQQSNDMASHYTDLIVSERKAAQRKDGRQTYVRSASAREISGKELTGFVDFGSYIFFVVCFGPDYFEEKNLRKLNYILKYAQTHQLSIDNTIVIQALTTEMRECSDPIQRAGMARQVAYWYSEEKNNSKELEYLRASFNDDPTHYENTKNLIYKELMHGDINVAIVHSLKFFTANCNNPVSMQDIIYLFSNAGKINGLKTLVAMLKKVHSDNAEAMANIQFHYGLYLLDTDDHDDAVNWLLKAKASFLAFDKSHYILADLDMLISSFAPKQTSSLRSDISL